MLPKKPFPREIVPLYIIKLIKVTCSHVTEGNSSLSWSQIILTPFLRVFRLRTQLQASVSFVGKFMQLFTAHLFLISVFFISESWKH